MSFTPQTTSEAHRALFKCLEGAESFPEGIHIKGFLFEQWRTFLDARFQEIRRPYGSTPTDHIVGILLSNKYRKSSTRKVADQAFRRHLTDKISNIVTSGQPITLVLPSFPFKSGNFAKSQRRLPDLAEIASLSRLWEIVQLVQQSYKPGMQIVILSDGALLSHVFNVNPYFPIAYEQTLNQWIHRMDMQSSIKIFNLKTLLHESFPGFGSEISKEADRLQQEPLDPVIAHQLSQSLRFNYDNRFWVQKFIAMCLKNFSVETTMQFLQQHDPTVASRIPEYQSLWGTIERLQALESLFPGHIRATPHAFKHDLKLTLHLINNSTIVLPWMGVGVVKQSGSLEKGIITAKYEHDLTPEKYAPIFWHGQETPFGYLEVPTH